MKTVRAGIRHNKHAVKGFTLLETIAVFLIIGVLAAIVLPNLSLDTFRQTGFFQQSLSSVRFAQKLAIASGCSVQVQINASGCNLNWSACGAASGNPISNPASGDNNFCRDSAGTGSPSANFIFDTIGRPSTGQSITIGTRTITVEAETGYVHE